MKIKSISRDFFSTKSLIGISISFICLYYVYLNFNFNSFIGHIITLDFSLLFLSLFTIFLSLIVRAIRWKMIFNSNDILIYDLYRSEVLGFWGNSLFPLKLGELMKIHYAKILTQKKYSTVLGTIIIERLADFIIIAPFLILLYIYFPGDFFIGKIESLIILIILFSSLTLLLKYVFVSLKNKIKNIFKGFKIFEISKNKNSILFSTIILWVLIFLDVYFIQASMIDLDLTLFECFCIMLVGTIVYIIPSSPGTFGTFHLAIQEFMIVFLDKSESISIAFAFILHAHSYIFFIIVGTYYFSKDSKNILSLKVSHEVY
tara:strand:+ start:1536 stop:2486 length:951 start_codon:yes stop_codon:yes gene_type:complete